MKKVTQISKVGYSRKLKHRDLNRVSFIAISFHVRKTNRVLFLNAMIMQIRNHAQNGNPGPMFKKVQSRLQQVQISPKLIDDKALHPLSLMFFQEFQRTNERSKDPTPIDICYQQNGSIGHF